MDARGVFIVIEGTDGSGKSTQLSLIKKRLEEAGHDIAIFKFPRYDQDSSYFVRKYLEGGYGKVDDVGPYTSSLFYALDRFEAAPAIREALREGKVVLVDRFTGSNMAHQGTKIENAEQRRGFFIWLDNLEFEMLRVPRPNISFIMRVPPDISQKLMAEKDKDLHEADRSHLERAIAVYDDMAQLFPKDFQRIDCVRGGQLLGVEDINAILWEKISPILPPPSGKKPSATEAATLPAQATPPIKDKQEPEEQKAKPPAARYLTINGASSLLAQKISRVLGDKAHITRPDIPAVYTPERLVPEAEKEYTAKTNALLGLYAKLVAGLGKRGISLQEARRMASLALPVAAACDIRIDADEPLLEELIISLINDTLPEAQSAGASLFAQAIKVGAEKFLGTSQPVRRNAPSAIKDLAEEFLNQNHIGEQPPVQLVSVWPRNENDLIADMLYEHSGLPLRTIQDRVASWPMDRKLAVIEAYLSDTQPGPALEKAHYSWDLLSSYLVFCELQNTPTEALEIQPLTPRHGFDMPGLIDEADLGDTYEKCFDLSLELYSALQKAGHMTDAQYATLNGHIQRWKMTQNAAQALRLLRQQNTSPESQKLLQQMRAKLGELHPTIAETIAPAR